MWVWFLCSLVSSQGSGQQSQTPVQSETIDNAIIISIALPRFFAHVQEHVANVSWLNASTHPNYSSLPLITRYMIDHGRSHHFEIGRLTAVGCFQSHIRAWHKVQNTTLILEEDGYLHSDFGTQIDRMVQSLSMSNISWHVIMLNAKVWHVVQGKPLKVHSLAYMCPKRSTCTWSGTRGYLINRKGAQLLLENLEPFTVQVDAYLALMQLYHPQFRLLWSHQELVHQYSMHMTTIWDFCTRCYVPFNAFVYLIFFLLYLVARSVYTGNRLFEPTKHMV